MTDTTTQRMDPDVRERAVLPILIPVATIVVTEIVVYSMSRVLLTAGKTPATVIALLLALGILFGAAFIAARPRIRTATIVGLLVVLGLATVAAGVVAEQRGPADHGGEHAAEGVAVHADDLVFDTKEIELPAGKATIELDNADSVTHNIAIFPDSESLDAPLFRGDIINGGAHATYEVELEAGEYYFHCDVHPEMNGSVKAH